MDIYERACSDLGSCGKPLYITAFGSKLYGTATVNSDTDYKIIYLPSKEDMLIGYHPKTFTRNSSDDHTKNTKDDIDIEYKPLQNFLSELARGDTGAVDIAFSYTNPHVTKICDDRMNFFFQNVDKFFTVSNVKSFVGFAQSQAIKYSVKGECLSVLSDIVEYLEKNREAYSDLCLKHFYADLIEQCGHESYCFLKKTLRMLLFLTKCMVLESHSHILQIRSIMCISNTESEQRKSCRNINRREFQQIGNLCRMHTDAHMS